MKKLFALMIFLSPSFLNATDTDLTKKMIDFAKLGNLNDVYPILQDNKTLHKNHIIQDIIFAYSNYLEHVYGNNWSNKIDSQARYVTALFELALITKKDKCIHELFAKWGIDAISLLKSEDIGEFFLKAAKKPHKALFEYLLIFLEKDNMWELVKNELFMKAFHEIINKSDEHDEIIKMLTDRIKVIKILSQDNLEEILGKIDNNQAIRVYIEKAIIQKKELLQKTPEKSHFCNIL